MIAGTGSAGSSYAGAHGTKSSTTNTHRNTTTKKETEPIIASVAGLYSVYEQNEINADLALVGSPIMLTGTVYSVEMGPVDIPIVMLEDNDGSYNQVKCLFPDDDQLPMVMSLEKGQTITIRGICNGKPMSDIVLVACRF